MLFIFSVTYSGNTIVSPNGELLEDCGNHHYAYLTARQLIILVMKQIILAG